MTDPLLLTVDQAAPILNLERNAQDPDLETTLDWVSARAIGRLSDDAVVLASIRAGHAEIYVDLWVDACPHAVWYRNIDLLPVKAQAALMRLRREENGR